jgi:DNA polymerase type B, organellar and viral
MRAATEGMFRVGEAWPAPASSALLDITYLFGADLTWHWILKHCHPRTERWLVSPEPVRLIRALKLSEMVAAKRVRCLCWVDEPNVTVTLFHTPRGKLWICGTGQYHSLNTSVIDSQLTELLAEWQINALRTMTPWERLCWSHEKHCRIMGELLLLCNTWSPKCWGPTATSIAWSAWLRHYPCDTIYRHNDLIVQKMERKASYGGRIEMFYHGNYKARVYRWDAISHYPNVGITAKVPTRLAEVNSAGRKDTLRAYYQGLCSIALVEVADYQRDFPIRWNGHTQWARGNYRTWLAGEELRRAIEQGSVTRVIWSATYETGKCFSRISNELLQLRTGNGPVNSAGIHSFAKSAYTGLFGRLGRRSTMWESAAHVAPRVDLGTWTRWHLANGRGDTFRYIGNGVERDAGVSQHRDSWQAGAAVFLAACRCEIDKWCDVVGRENILYIGCDSLHLNADGNKRMEAYIEATPTMQGRMRLDCTGNEAEYRGLYDYSLGSKTVKSGIDFSRITKAQPGEQENGYRLVLADELVSPGQARPEAGPRGAVSQLRYSDRLTSTGVIRPLVIPHPEARADN